MYFSWGIKIEKFFCNDLSVKLIKIPLIFSNNNSGIFMAYHPVIKQKSKHIKTDIHFVRELISFGHLNIKYICSSNQLADVFTKAVVLSTFEY